jgi:peptidoglycan/xylan/chitin deacetylase (PgdA/CDA1 family)
LLARSGPAALSRRAFRRRTLILAYHNILPDGAKPAGDRSLHLSRAAFARQLDCLVEYCEVVSLADALAVPPPEASSPRVVITFDDAYQGAVTVGIDELVHRGLPATLFVAPAFLGGRSFWWDAVGASQEGGLPEPVREAALRECGGKDALVREWARRQSLPMADLPTHTCAASEQELALAAKRPGITLGSHTWSHPNLAVLPAAELPEELDQSLAWLRQRFPNVVEWLSYPYGLTGAAAVAAARAAGYRGGLLVSGGWLPETSREPFAMPRLNIPAGLSTEGFIIRTAGLLCR